MYNHIYTWILDPVCFCDFAPLNSNSSARAAHTHNLKLSKNIQANNNKNNNHHDISDSTSNITTNISIRKQHYTHTLSTLLKRISLALSPAKPIHFAWFGLTCWLRFVWLWLGSVRFYSPRAIRFFGFASLTSFTFHYNTIIFVIILLSLNIEYLAVCTFCS